MVTVYVCNHLLQLRSGSCFVFRQETCDNDDDFTEGLIEELPPGVQGCVRPKSPDNSFLRVETNSQACS